MAASATLMRPSLHTEPFYRPKGRRAVATHEPWPLMKWHGSHDGRITVRLSLSLEGKFPPMAHYRTAYSAKSKKGQASLLHRAGGGYAVTKEEENSPLPLLTADQSAYYGFIPLENRGNP